MNERSGIPAEEFLKLYRRLEGLLEMRYAGRKTNHSSVVMEYLDDPDSLLYRTQIDLCREIRNLLTHNADENGDPVVEPSESMINTMRRIIDHVQKPRMAVDCGTPKDRILFAHPNERVKDVIRAMRKQGYSHVPVKDGKKLVGVFSAASLLIYLEGQNDMSVGDELRIADLKDAIEFTQERSEKYMFLPVDATIPAVRDTFQKRRERNSRVAAVFITQDGNSTQDILAMLTPWDVLRENNGAGREEP